MVVQAKTHALLLPLAPGKLHVQLVQLIQLVQCEVFIGLPNVLTFPSCSRRHRWKGGRIGVWRDEYDEHDKYEVEAAESFQTTPPPGIDLIPTS